MTKKIECYGTRDIKRLFAIEQELIKRDKQ